MPEPMWTYCPARGAGRRSALAIDINDYGDGYVHRSTRGLNPVRAEWDLTFPFRDLVTLDAMDQFLRLNATGGFWFLPPDSGVELFATCDEWTATIIDRSRDGDKVGELRAAFKQAFNPQPLDQAPGALLQPPPLAGPLVARMPARITAARVAVGIIDPPPPGPQGFSDGPFRSSPNKPLDASEANR